MLPKPLLNIITNAVLSYPLQQHNVETLFAEELNLTPERVQILLQRWCLVITTLPISERIGLYKLITEVLVQTWYKAADIPLEALIFLNPPTLIRLLSVLAYWLHLHRPAGLMTREEVYQTLKSDWTFLPGYTWHEDDASNQLVQETESLLIAAHKKTGLFVERTTNHYGFIHPVFQTYYTARYLIAYNRLRARLIRQHLHNAHWTEPILLALSFLGADYPDEAHQLINTAILATTPEATKQGFGPSLYENFLGRDYLFALQCLAQNIPVAPNLQNELLDRLSDEFLYCTGLARFQPYYQALTAQLEDLAGTQTGLALITPFSIALQSQSQDVCIRGITGLGYLKTQEPNIIDGLIAFLFDENWRVRVAAATSLGQLNLKTEAIIHHLLTALADEYEQVALVAGQSLKALRVPVENILSTILIHLKSEYWEMRRRAAKLVGLFDIRHQTALEGLLFALQDVVNAVRIAAIESLGQVGIISEDVLNHLLNLVLYDKEPLVRKAARKSMVALGHIQPETIQILLTNLEDDDWQVRRRSAQILGQLKIADATITIAMLTTLGDTEAPVRSIAAQSLGIMGQKEVMVIASLLAALLDQSATVRARAAVSLGQLNQKQDEVLIGLLAAVGDEEAEVRQNAVASLGQIGDRRSEVIDMLLSAVRDTVWQVRVTAARSLHQLGYDLEMVINIFLDITMQADDVQVRATAAHLLGQIAAPESKIVSTLRQGLFDTEPEMQAVCAAALVTLGQRHPNIIPQMAQRLVSIIEDPIFDKSATSDQPGGRQYAYRAFWALMGQ